MNLPILIILNLRNGMQLMSITGHIQTGVIGRVDRSGAWAGNTARSTEEWVATATGVSWGEAKGRVELAGALHQLPETTAALTTGRISGSQAALVARAASVDPHAEYRMLDLAGRASVKELKDAAQRVVASASGQTDEEQAAVHRTRFLRTWTGTDGAFHLQGRMTKADGAKVLAVLEPLMEIEFTNARRQGRRESPDAYRADALVALAERGSLAAGRRSRTSAARGSGEGTEPIAADMVDAPVSGSVITLEQGKLSRNDKIARSNTKAFVKIAQQYEFNVKYSIETVVEKGQEKQKILRAALGWSRHTQLLLRKRI